MNKIYWYIFNQSGEIISKEYETEEEAINAMKKGEYDEGEKPDYIDGFYLEEESKLNMK